MHQFWRSVTRGLVDGWQEGWVGVGDGEGGGKKPQVKTRGHRSWSPSDGPDHSTIGQRDTIPIKGRIPGWLHPIGVLHKCQSVGHGFSKVVDPPPRKADQLNVAMGDMLYK